MKKKIALIGSNGQLGVDITKVFSKDAAFDLVPLTHKDIEIENTQAFRNVLDAIKPAILISTAAYHRVDEVEANPEKAFLINGIASRNLAQYCEERKSVFVFFSTDYVFGKDKRHNTPYKETDNPGPVNAYGISKLAGEHFVAYATSRYFIVRTTGLFGIAGSSGKGGNFVETIIGIGKKEGRVKIVNDQILTPTYTVELARQVKELIKTRGYGLYHATAEGDCSWYDFAKEIFRLLNMDVTLEPITSEELARSAKRPSYSVLENYNLKKLGINIMKPWRTTLKAYLKEKGYV